MKIRLHLTILCTITLLALAACASMRPSAPTGVQRLYVLYCGEARIPDISPWSPGVNIGQPALFSDIKDQRRDRPLASEPPMAITGRIGIEGDHRRRRLRRERRAENPRTAARQGGRSGGHSALRRASP